MIHKVTRPIVVPGGPHIDGRPLSRFTELGAAWGPTVHGLSLANGQALFRPEMYPDSRVSVGFNTGSATLQHIACGNHASLETTAVFTFEAWVRFNVSHSTYNCFMRKSHVFHRGVWVQPTGILRAYIGHATTSADSQASSLPLALGVWTHVACTYDSAGDKKIRLYVNGVETTYSTQTAGVGAPTDYTAGHLFIGGHSTTYRFDGRISDVRLWNVARSVANILADMNSRLIGDEAGLVGYWKLDDRTGLTAADSTVNANDGTLTNGPWWVVEGFAACANTNNRHLIRVYDSTRKAATGYIDVAGGGEALGAELVTNGDNEAAAATFGTSTASRGTRSQSAEQARGGANSLKFLKNADAGTGYLNFNDTTLALVSPGKLYDIAFWVYLPSGQTGHTVRTDWWYHNVPAWPRVRIDVTTTDTWVQVAFRGTVNNHCQFNVQLVDGVDTDKFYLDDFTIKEVTDCATDGVHIVSSPGGAQNWKSIQPGFLYNDSAYKLEVFKTR